MSECVQNNTDNLSFEDIFDLHHRRVYALCLHMTGSVAEAEELTQEVFVHVFRKLGSFRGEKTFSARLQRLTVNRVLMHFRRNLVGTEQTTINNELPAVPVESTQRFNRTPVLDRITLKNVITGLPLGSRLVFILNDVKEGRHNETACASGRTSKSRLHKARMKLRQRLTRRIPRLRSTT